MINEKPKQCKSRGCCNPVLDGKYCVNCTQIRKEKRDKFLKAAGGTVLGIGSLALAVVFKKPPNIRLK